MRKLQSIAGALCCALLLALFATAAPAQCVIGVYADEDGTIGNTAVPPAFVSTDIYIVMRVESTVAGVAFVLNVPPDFLISALSYGPSGGGLSVPNGGGDNVGLGECAIGFGNLPIEVAHYQILLYTGFQPTYVLTLGPNTFESPDYPVYADCADNLIECTGVSDLYLYGVSVDDKSIGSVKALYGN